jgi:hypothetical protein
LLFPVQSLIADVQAFTFTAYSITCTGSIEVV